MNSADPGLGHLGAWLEATGVERQSPQHPIHELIAEHRLLTPVLDAMEIEGNRLRHGRDIQVDFWEQCVDFTGNFIHMCHRRKEEEVLFPALERLGWKERAEMAEEHRRSMRATLAIVEAVSDGDWEMTLRLASAYAAGMRRHMAREEASVFADAHAALGPEDTAAVRQAFDRVNALALSLGAHHPVELARKMCARAGLDLSRYGVA